MRSSPAGLGIDSSALAPPASDIPRLASPFTYSTWGGPTRSGRHHRREVSQNQFDTVHITGHRLLSPLRLEPDMSSNANKRRAQHVLEEELSPSGSVLAEKSKRARTDLHWCWRFESTSHSSSQSWCNTRLYCEQQTRQPLHTACNDIDSCRVFSHSLHPCSSYQPGSPRI